VIGREGGQVRLMVVAPADGEPLRKVVRRVRWPMLTVNSEEWQG
jgi:hypothetical protein